MVPMDWTLAGALLAAALVEAEVTRRVLTGRERVRTRTATISAWMFAGAVAVPFALAAGLALILCVYRDLRRKHADPVAWVLAGGSVAAAHYLVAVPGIDPVVSAAVAAAVCLGLGRATDFLRHRRGLADVGLDGSLLAAGALVGLLAPGGVLVVLAGIPVVVMLNSAALSRQLEDAAAVDQKTGLATAAAWQDHADRACTGGAQVGVLMVDLDHFKRLNDTYGHRAGDDVLAAVGACLRSQLRETDVAGRFGGEEFTVLLPGADADDTMAAAERIRAAIERLRVTTIDKQCDHAVITDVTASVGVAVRPADGATADACLRIADANVYRAKQDGRNTVVGVEPDVVLPFIPNQRDGA
jgi:diguanylate cyclase (GGDEF)-like protein